MARSNADNFLPLCLLLLLRSPSRISSYAIHNLNPPFRRELSERRKAFSVFDPRSRCCSLAWNDGARGVRGRTRSRQLRRNNRRNAGEASSSLAGLKLAGTDNNNNADEPDNNNTDGQSSAPNPTSCSGVTLKMAFDASDSWAVADASEAKSERFTSPESLDMVHRLRRCSDCVLVGRGTVEVDDCTLTVRRVELAEGREQPVRVVIDPNLRLLRGGDGGGADLDYAMLKDGLPVILYHCGANADDSTALGDGNGAIQAVDLCQKGEERNKSGSKSGGSSRISSKDIVTDLNRRGIHHIMVEGGPATALSFLKEKMVDRAIIVRAPVTFDVPVPSHMSEGTLREAGLVKLGSCVLGTDAVDCWSRPGLAWPSGGDLSRWP